MYEEIAAEGILWWRKMEGSKSELVLEMQEIPQAAQDDLKGLGLG